MGAFTIYSIGDSAFLEQVLIAVAMISGAGDFDKMIAVGLLIGFLIICFQSLFNGAQKVDIQQIFMCWVLYAMLFGPTTTVLIEDAYSGDVRPVSNVPIGVGAAGGIISTVGYRLTNMFETGFGVIASGLTENQFADSLKILNKVRRNMSDPLVFQAINQANGGGHIDYRRSWGNYIRECTLIKIDMGEMSVDDLLRQPIDQSLPFNSSLYGTKIYDNPTDPSGSDYDCNDAYNKLDEMGEVVGSSPEVDNAIAELIDYESSYGFSALGKISDSLSALGVASSHNYDFVKASIIEPVYYDAAAGKYQDMHDYSSAMMVNQAIQQRNMQWAAEQTMFMSIVRPMLTFIEGFVFSITPLMAFLIVLGSFGIKLVTKYGQMLLWTQLWMPVLAIINLFLYMAATGEMSSYSSDGLTSFYAINDADQVLSSWIATGGMLAASTPILTLFLVTGSAYAFTSMASRMQGGDHIDEKSTTPDTVKSGPVMQSVAENTHDTMSGNIASGAEQLVGSLKLGNMLSSNVSSSKAHAEQASEQFSNTLANSVTEGASQEQMYQRLSSLGRTVGSTDTEASRALNSAASSYMQDNSIGNEHRDAVLGAFKLAGSAGAGVPKSLPINAGGSVEGASSSQEQNSTSISTSEASKYLQDAGYSSEHSAQMTDSLAESMTNTSGEAFRSTLGSEQRETLQEQASEVVSTTEQYQEAEQLSESLGSQTDISFNTLANQVMDSPEAQDIVRSGLQFSNSAVKEEAADLAERYAEQYNMPEEKSFYAGALKAMSNSNNYDPGEEYGGYNTVLRATSEATGMSLGDAPQAHENQDLTNRSPETTGDVKDEVQQNIEPPASIDHDATRDVAASTTPEQDSARLEDVGGRGSAVDQHHREAANQVKDTARAEASYMADGDMPRILDMLSDDDYMSTSVGTFGKIDSAEQLVDQTASTVASAVGMPAEALGSLVQKLSGMSDDELSSMQTKFENGETPSSSNFPELHTENSGAIREGFGTLLRGIMGDSVETQGMSDAEFATYNLGQTGSLLRDEGQALSSFDANQELQQRQYAHAQNSYGLTDTQSQLYAMQFDTSQLAGNILSDGVLGHMIENGQALSSDDYIQKEESLIEQMKVEAAENMGIPRSELSQEVEEGIENVADRIRSAADAGDQAGSILNPVSAFNQNMVSRDPSMGYVDWTPSQGDSSDPPSSTDIIVSG